MREIFQVTLNIFSWKVQVTREFVVSEWSNPAVGWVQSGNPEFSKTPSPEGALLD